MSLLFAPEIGEQADEQENGKSDDHKIQHGLYEVSIVYRDGRLFDSINYPGGFHPISVPRSWFRLPATLSVA